MPVVSALRSLCAAALPVASPRLQRHHTRSRPQLHVLTSLSSDFLYDIMSLCRFLSPSLSTAQLCLQQHGDPELRTELGAERQARMQPSLPAFVVSAIAAAITSPYRTPISLSCTPLLAVMQARAHPAVQEAEQPHSAGRSDAGRLEDDDDDRRHALDHSRTEQRAAVAPQTQQPPSPLMIDTPLHPPPAALCLPFATVEGSQPAGAAQQLFAYHCSIIARDDCAVALLTAQPLPLSALQPAGLTPHADCLQLSEAQVKLAQGWMQRTMAAVVRRAAGDWQREGERRRQYLLVPVLRDDSTAALSVDWTTMSQWICSDAARLGRTRANCRAAEQTGSARSSPLSMPLLRLLRSLPVVLYRLESQLQALSFLQAAGLPDSFLPLTLTALTSRNADQSSHYERLEFLGDAFIKMAMSTALFSQRPTAAVEELTEARIRLSSNAQLGELGVQHGLLDCIRARSFNQYKMAVAGVTDADPEPLSRDVIADAVEAAVAACYLQGGDGAALTLMQRLGLPCRHASPASDDFDLTAVCAALSPPQSQLVQHFLSSSLPAIESRLEYRFRSPFLLLSAFCHQSCDLPLEHRRLAFVGEAAAAFLISEQLYQQPAAPQPGEMTQLRQRHEGLDAHGRLLQQLSLHSHILCMGEQHSLLQRWQQEEAGLKTGSQPRWVPRLFSDVMKSMFGAVLVDSGMRTEALRTVWQRVTTLPGVTKHRESETPSNL